jgi:hypothetical protein
MIRTKPATPGEDYDQVPECTVEEMVKVLQTVIRSVKKIRASGLPASRASTDEGPRRAKHGDFGAREYRLSGLSEKSH